MEMTYQNTLLKVTAILMIVFAVLGLVSAGMISMDVQKELGGSSSGFTSMIMEIAMEDPSFAAQAGIDDPEQFYELMQDEEFQSVMGGVFAVISAVMILFAAIAAIPRAIAGIMGLSRSSRPEKSGFFMAWGIVLLILGVIGMLFSGGVFSLNGLVSLVGGVVLPILYLVGSSQQKKAYLASLSAAQGAGSNYAAMPAGSSPKAPPAAPEAPQQPENKGPEF